jgi:hypothetical protein
VKRREKSGNFARHFRVLTADSNHDERKEAMKLLLTLFFWMLLLVLCWPVAILALLLWPILWLISIPFRIVGIAVQALLAFVKALLFLPARLLGYREAKA